VRKGKLIVCALGIVVAVVAWYLFRPELLFVNARVHEGFPEASASKTVAATNPAVVLAQGQFHTVAHTSRGTATVHRLSDGKRVLRFTDFETSNGPDLHVYLVAAGDATDSAAVTQAGFLDLGRLKGNLGEQNYELPAEADLARYQAVTVWCQRFSVNFATAPLAKAVVP
jgi:hypothetical protein